MKELLQKLATGSTLTADEATLAFEAVMTGEASEAQTAALLAMIQLRGATVDEMLGAARVMRSKAVHVDVPDGLTVIDTCGTGGDHAGTFNISTAAALVAAGALRPRGVAVAKHGNRSVTSKSGSSQVLETLGVNLQVPCEVLTQCLAEAGMAFCFAPAHHPAMKYAGPVRQQLGFRTLFNLIGPLTNPAGARRQLMGVFDARLLEPIAQVLLGLGAERAMMVFGQLPEAEGIVAGFDELSVCGPSQVMVVEDGRVKPGIVDATSLDMPLALPHALRASGPEDSARIIRDVLGGRHGPTRDVTVLNAGAAIVVAGEAEDLAEGVAMAQQAIDQGAAGAVLERLVELTHGA